MMHYQTIVDVGYACLTGSTRHRHCRLATASPRQLLRQICLFGPALWPRQMNRTRHQPAGRSPPTAPEEC